MKKSILPLGGAEEGEESAERERGESRAGSGASKGDGPAAGQGDGDEEPAAAAAGVWDQQLHGRETGPSTIIIYRHCHAMVFLF